METTYMYMDKEDVMYIHSGILLIHKNEWNNAIWSNMDGPRDYHTKWSKSGRKRQIPYASTHSQSKTWHRVTGAGLPWQWWQRRGWRHRSSSACKAFGPCKARGSSSELADNQCRLGLGCRWGLWKKRAGRREAFLPSSCSRITARSLEETPWKWDLSSHKGDWVPEERNWAAQAVHQETKTSWWRWSSAHSSPWNGYLLLPTSV